MYGSGVTGFSYFVPIGDLGKMLSRFKVSQLPSGLADCVLVKELGGFPCPILVKALFFSWFHRDLWVVL